MSSCTENLHEVEEVCKEDFAEMMKDDQRQDEADMRLEFDLRTDYDLFISYHQAEFTDFINAVQELKRLHKQYDHEFTFKDLEDMI